MIDKTQLGLRIRKARKDRNFILKDLEARAGVSATHLSEIERGLTSPSIQVLAKIARALGRPAKFFLETNWLDNVARVSMENRTAPVQVGEGTLAQSLTAGIAGHRLGMILLRLEPGTQNEVEEGAHEGDEAVLVLSGSITVVLDGREIRLESSDSLHYSCNQPHVIRNASSVAVAEVAWATDRRPALSQRRRADRASAA